MQCYSAMFMNACTGIYKSWGHICNCAVNPSSRWNVLDQCAWLGSSSAVFVMRCTASKCLLYDLMTESCRFGLGAMIPLPPNRLVPHGALLNTSVPVCFVPDNQLLRFLFFHQIPMIQSSIIDDLVKKVEEVLALAAAGTEE